MANLIAKAGKLAGILSVPVWRHALFRHRVAAGVEHANILRQLGMVGTVVDVGANRGQFALAARHCFPAARIVSFEPQEKPAAVFRNVFAGDLRTTLIEVAVGPEQGEAELHLSERDDSSSLLPITAAQNAIFPGTVEVGTTVIRVARLADHVRPELIEIPALLKLDVQGFELKVLAGCDDLLEHFTWIYAECSFLELYAGQALADEVIAWLREHGFGLRGAYHMEYDRQGEPVQADFLFSKLNGSCVIDKN